METKISFDIAIIGAGTSGLHLAQLLSNANIRVLLIDQHEFSESGPFWLNGVPPWMFEKADLELPKSPELFFSSKKFIITSNNKYHKITIKNPNILEVRMDLLSQRLKDMFSGQFLQAKINNIITNKNNNISYLIAANKKKEYRIYAKIFIDASGFKGVLKKYFWPPFVSDTCIALQQTYKIINKEKALNFLQKNKSSPGDIFSQVGVLGPYSLFRYHINEELNKISFLSGMLTSYKTKKPHELIYEFLKNYNFVGDNIIDGRGAIRLSYPLKELVRPRLALIGEAAHQIYAMHASGIGFGLIAAQILAKHLIHAKNNAKDFTDIKILKNYETEFNDLYYKILYQSKITQNIVKNLSANFINKVIFLGKFFPAIFEKSLRQR